MPRQRHFPVCFYDCLCLTSILLFEKWNLDDAFLVEQEEDGAGDQEQAEERADDDTGDGAGGKSALLGSDFRIGRLRVNRIRVNGIGIHGLVFQYNGIGGEVVCFKDHFAVHERCVHIRFVALIVDIILNNK